jgi:hypothetical protein
VFDAIHVADPDPKVMAYQYLQALPQIAQGSANKVWIVPAELTRALEGIGGAVGGLITPTSGDRAISAESAAHADEVEAEARQMAEAAAQAAQEATDEARRAEAVTGVPRGLPASEGIPVSAVLADKAVDNAREHA